LPAQSDINAAWRMGGITVGPVEDYLYSLLPPRDEVLTEIEEEAAKRNLPYVYLGYYVKHCLSLEYKARFAPNEVLGPDGIWSTFVA
jgi:tagatose-1,6-bisphosphate aldolase